jgi:hypothetical protein
MDVVYFSTAALNCARGHLLIGGNEEAKSRELLDKQKARAYRQRTLVGTLGASHFFQVTHIKAERRIPAPCANSAN